MHFNIALIATTVLATISSTGATHIDIYAVLPAGFGIPVTTMTMVTNANAHYSVLGKNDAIDGCRTNGIKNLEQFWMDTKKKKRGHFKWKDQGFKRCLKRTTFKVIDGACWNGRCQQTYWYKYTETKCTWWKVCLCKQLLYVGISWKLAHIDLTLEGVDVVL